LQGEQGRRVEAVRAMSPTLKFSTRTSARIAIVRIRSAPSRVARSMVIERLLRLVPR
jgi:hypothetical protein